MLYCDPFLGRFDSAVWEDGREERAWKRLSKKLFAAEKRSKNYGYIFKTYGELCAIMSVKHGLGVKTRKAYSERNYEELKKLEGDVGGKCVLKKHLDDVQMFEMPASELKDLDSLTEIHE